MTHWIVPTNFSRFHLDEYLKDYKEVIWNHRANFKVGDIAFIYVSEPYRRLMYVMEVTKANISKEEEESFPNDNKYHGNNRKQQPKTHKLSILKLISTIPDTTNLSYDNFTNKSFLNYAIRDIIRVQGEFLEYIQNELSNLNEKTTWLLISNNDYYRFDDLLLKQDIIVWRQKENFEKDDIIYVYTTKPFSRITYKMVCIGANLKTSKYLNDEEYWNNEKVDKNLMANFGRYAEFKLIEKLPNIPQLSFKVLKKYGLKTVQSSHRINTKLLNYIESVLQLMYTNNDCEIDYPNDKTVFSEGAVMKVLVNKYERNAKARQECINKLGDQCVVCGCKFSERYGKLGKGFIHVHHIVPIGNIGKEYVLNPITDLVPVCPNCHYMMHRRNPPYSVSEMKKIINTQE